MINLLCQIKFLLLLLKPEIAISLKSLNQSVLQTTVIEYHNYPYYRGMISAKIALKHVP